MPQHETRTAPRASARSAAVEILNAVLEQGEALDAAFARFAEGLAARDRGFARAIATTALRRLGRIDRALSAYLAKPLPDSAGLARAMLRAGAAQLLFLGTPPHAGVGEMTALAGAMAPARRYKNLVNAVLRRIAEGGAALLAPMTPLDDWPDWLTQSWRRAYGADAALRIAEASGREPPLDLTVKADPKGWAGRLGGVVTPTGAVRLEQAGEVGALEGYGEGGWWVQDAAAALPARLLGDVAGARVADLCAAPGGKTLQLAAAGAVVTALDRSAQRLERVRDNLERTGLNAEVIAADAASYASDAPFDAVLLDAPCSATGTLRRRPDVAWTKSPRDVASLRAVQVELIGAAARLTRPGGRVVFCTCSLQPEEGRGALDAALKAGAPLGVDPVRADELPGLPAEAFSDDGTVRVFPYFLHEPGGMDGFFMARLTRLGEG